MSVTYTYDQITEQQAQSTLADFTEDYMLEKKIFNEKYYPSYLKYAANAWAEIFTDTLYIYNARWLPVKNINGTYYVNFPKDCKTFISANVINDCNLLKQIPYSSQINVIAKPNPDIVSCSDAIASFVTTSKYLFTNGNVDYYETQYLQYCPNGDIVEVTQTPTKKYLDYTGDIRGDYNPDYNNDYSHPQSGFSNFTIETITTQRILTNLDTGEDGCPVNSDSNINKLVTYCSCYSHYLQHCNLKPIYSTLEHFGVVTLTENRKGLIYTPPKYTTYLLNSAIPDYILVYFRGNPNGNEITGAAIIPDDWYITNALTLGIEYYSIRLNNSFTWNDKRFARAQFDHALNEIIRSKLNMSTDLFQKISSIKPQW